VGLPTFLLRKLYRRGSLRETGDGRFAFSLQNPLGNATVIAPPEIVVNGILHPPEEIQMGHLDLAAVSPDHPFVFARGDDVELRMAGRLLRGGNRIHIGVITKEFGEISFLVEDREADFCDIPGGEEE